jgi:hypothetical protein
MEPATVGIGETKPQKEPNTVRFNTSLVALRSALERLEELSAAVDESPQVATSKQPDNFMLSVSAILQEGPDILQDLAIQINEVTREIGRKLF